MRSLGAAVATVALSALCAGCGSDSEEPQGSGGSGNTFSCSQQTDTYSVGLAKDSSKGTFRVELMDAEPAPPQKRTNVWMIHLSDAQAAHLSGVDVRVTPRMPEHGHGSTEQTAVTDLGDGMYELNPVFLHMAGYWVIEISVTQGGQTDTAEYEFCITP